MNSVFNKGVSCELTDYLGVVVCYLSMDGAMVGFLESSTVALSAIPLGTLKVLGKRS